MIASLLGSAAGVASGEAFVWDWGSFVATLLSTLAGGAIAIAASVWIFRLQVRAQLKDRFNDALAYIVESTGAHASATKLHAENPTLAAPDDLHVLAAITRARFQTSDASDIALLNALREHVFASRTLDPAQRWRALTEIWPAIIVWRDDASIDWAIERLARSRTVAE